MNNQLPQYEVYALKYATTKRERHENFIHTPDPHDGPMPMDYFVWLIRNNDRHFLVDTGFNQPAGLKRKRQWLHCPIGSLLTLGLQAEDISDVILTHLHFDHAGNLDLLPNAKFHLQESELHYSVGSDMKLKPLRHSYTSNDITYLVESVYQDRVVFYNGDSHLAPGIELIHIGGHTKGLQSVRVHTARGWIILASDASHFYENIETDSPFPVVHNVGDMLKGYRRLMSLSDSKHHLIPGHDPKVLALYPRHEDTSVEIALLHKSPNLEYFK